MIINSDSLKKLRLLFLFERINILHANKPATGKILSEMHKIEIKVPIEILTILLSLSLNLIRNGISIIIANIIES